MTNPGMPLGPAAHYLDATARGWTVQAFFDHDGAFRSGRATGPDTGNLELTLPEAIDTLERYGSPVPPTP